MQINVGHLASRATRAFTLIELLVTVAILSILAAMIFPVFAKAKAAAKNAVAISNFKQSATAVLLYSSDNDENLPLSNWGGLPTQIQRPEYPDFSFWSNAVQPYLRSMQVLRNPLNPGAIDSELSLGADDRPLTTATGPDLAKAMRGLAYNYHFLSPKIQVLVTDPPGIGRLELRTLSRSTNSLLESQMLLLVDGVWERTASGYPVGGGSAFADAPCIYDSNGDSMMGLPSTTVAYLWQGGWNPSLPASFNVMGAAFGYNGPLQLGDETWRRRNEVKMTVAFLDTHVKLLQPDVVAAGCDVRDGQTGRVYAQSRYMWMPSEQD